MKVNFDNKLIDLPTDIQTLIFEDGVDEDFSCFNDNVNNLPNSIKHLAFGAEFANNLSKFS